jgi:ABC-type polysaccharide/polyol phosphate transport system ATPase subunit
MNNLTSAVEVEGIEKVFRVPHEKVSSLKGHATRMFRHTPVQNYRALDHVSFSIKKGEFFSIIGANGSGKSTLLKILAGIYEPSAGKIAYAGSLSTMIELGVGFNFDLSGRDNVYLNAALFGMTKSDVELVYDDIVKFAEIEEFMDQKVKNYSSGMQVRLAFAIAIQAQADIMIVDEVLAVGDANFQQKCFDVFRELKGQGKTIIFVSHDLKAVQDFSDRVLLLQHGKQIGIYDPFEAIDHYNKLNQLELTQTESVETNEVTEEEIDTTKPHILDVQLLDESGKASKSVARGSNVSVVLKIANPTLEKIEAGVSVQRNDGVYCFGTNTYLEKQSIPIKDVVEIRLDFRDIPLQKGKYNLIVGVFSKNMDHTYELRLKAKTFRVMQDDNLEGIVVMNRDWKF